MIAGTYEIKPKESAEACPICQAKRTNLSGHLLRVHKVSKKSSEVKGCRTKVDQVRKIADGPYFKIDQTLLKFEQEHFSNLDGARVSLKPGTAAKSKKRKMEAVPFLHSTNQVHMEGSWQRF